jgi:carboxymethylenebutenolidase
MGRWDEVSVDDSRMRCYLAQPQATNCPGVLVCMHGPGVDDFIRDICERLALRGFAAIAPDLYHRQREPCVEPWARVSDTEALRDMAQAVEALKALSGTDPERVAVIGFCMGGRLAFLYAANNPDLRAAVVFHGGNILVAREGFASPFEQARSIRAPVLGLFGLEDENPSPSDVQQIDAELTRLGKAHEFQSYAGAGHAFLNFTRPAVYRGAQATAAWAKCLAWLEKYLLINGQ